MKDTNTLINDFLNANESAVKTINQIHTSDEAATFLFNIIATSDKIVITDKKLSPKEFCARFYSHLFYKTIQYQKKLKTGL